MIAMERSGRWPAAKCRRLDHRDREVQNELAGWCRGEKEAIMMVKDECNDGRAAVGEGDEKDVEDELGKNGAKLSPRLCLSSPRHNNQRWTRRYMHCQSGLTQRQTAMKWPQKRGAS